MVKINKPVTVGSRWWAGYSERFVVTDLREDGDNIWVHYKNDKKDNPQEYSCYIEAFLSRFSGLPE